MERAPAPRDPSGPRWLPDPRRRGRWLWWDGERYTRSAHDGSGRWVVTDRAPRRRDRHAWRGVAAWFVCAGVALIGASILCSAQAMSDLPADRCEPQPWVYHGEWIVALVVVWFLLLALCVVAFVVLHPARGDGVVAIVVWSGAAALLLPPMVWFIAWSGPQHLLSGCG
jgi:hypothetical protein